MASKQRSGRLHDEPIAAVDRALQAAITFQSSSSTSTPYLLERHPTHQYRIPLVAVTRYTQQVVSPSCEQDCLLIEPKLV